MVQALVLLSAILLVPGLVSGAMVPRRGGPSPEGGFSPPPVKSTPARSTPCTTPTKSIPGKSTASATVTSVPPVHLLTGCPVSADTIPLPSGLAVPAGETLSYVALGYGVQNYTCNSGVYGSNMAVATLWDASCAVGTSAFTELTSEALPVAPNGAFPESITSVIGQSQLGNHYFQNFASGNTTTADPTFDFRATGVGSFSILTKTAAVASPNSTSDVAWISLNEVSGSLAKTVFRIQTAGGVAPSSCTTNGTVLDVNYSAIYLFYN